MHGDPQAAALAERLRPFVSDRRIPEAIAAVPRGLFVAERRDAYADRALPIGAGQTISQPLVVARMLELLAPRPGDRVLDVGTGSGWHAALLARLAGHVWSVERIPELARDARAALLAAGTECVTVIEGDGSKGLPAAAPFDRINVAAAAPRAALATLESQLAPGGRLVAPVEDSHGGQRLALVTRDGEGHLARESFEAVRFVPLVAG